MYLCVYTFVGERTHKYNWIYIYIYIFLCVYIYLNTCTNLTWDSARRLRLEKVHWLSKVRADSGLKKFLDFQKCADLNLKIFRQLESAPTSKSVRPDTLEVYLLNSLISFFGNKYSRRLHQLMICASKILTSIIERLCCMSCPQNWNHFRYSPATEISKKDHWPTVPKVVRYAPGHPSTKKTMFPLVVSNGPNTYPNTDTYPLIYQPVTVSRSISTVDSIPPTGEYIWYRHSIRFHIWRMTVDRWSSINNRDNLRLIHRQHPWISFSGPPLTSQRQDWIQDKTGYISVQVPIDLPVKWHVRKHKFDRKYLF